MNIIALGPGLTAVHFRAGGVSCVAIILDAGLPVIVYWGTDLGDLGPAEVGALIEATRQQVVGNPLDALMPVSILPEQFVGWPGTPGLSGSRQGEGFAPHFSVSAVEAVSADPPDPAWPHRLRLVAADEAVALELTLELEQSIAGLLRARASVTNHGQPYQLDALTLVFPVPNRAGRLMDFHGYWAKERLPQQSDFTMGTHLRESRHGRPGFDSPYLLMAASQFANRQGDVWATHVGWSGSQRALAERTPQAISVIGGGELPQPGEVVLGPDESYTSPWVYGCFSDTGLDGLAARFHTTWRARPNHPRRPRPVTLNSWQAVYFDHDLTKLSQLVRVAADIGVERFVLDDGWFAGRRDDTAGLGDWWVSPQAWPDGLKPLTDLVTDLGLEFGLWLEPEMVSPDSDLARAHPDWIAAPGDRLVADTRHQQVLNLTIPEAYQYIVSTLDQLLSQYPISSLKWDHNRDLVAAGDRRDGRPIGHRQTEAVWAVMAELKRRHPGLEIESCASGGARIDLGMADLVERFWVSDDIDALERQTIARWTNLLIPLEMMGGHVEAASSHTTGRTLDLSFRAATALFGHFGLEWDLTGLDQAVLAELKQWIELYKSIRWLLHSGTAVEADCPDPAHRLHGVVAPDRRDAVFEWVSLSSAQTIRPGPVQLPSLDDTITYRVESLAPSSPLGTTALMGGPVAWLGPDGLTVPGRILTRAGLAMPVLPPQRGLVFRVQAVD